MLYSFLYHKKLNASFKLKTLKNLRWLKRSKARIWVAAINPTHDEIELLREKFLLHPTTAEDIASPFTRIKYEEFENNTFIVLKGVKEIKHINIKFQTLFLIDGDQYVISVHHTPNEIIDNLMEKPQKIESMLRRGEDYLLHYLIDKEIDRYVMWREKISDDIKTIEEKFLKKPEKSIFKDLFVEEKLIIEIKQRTDSLTSVCLMLKKPTDNFIQNSLIPYFRDVYDHIFRVNEALKNYLERINGIRNSYLSLISTRLNESMRILTIIMAVMMPMTIITGYYGMNVKLPIQDNPYADVFIFGVMILTMILMLLAFKRLGWIGKQNSFLE